MLVDPDQFLIRARVAILRAAHQRFLLFRGRQGIFLVRGLRPAESL
jgi:hypothetical protein